MSPKVFLITGTSSGLGHQYAKTVLAQGHYVIATARNASKLSVEGANADNSLYVNLDITSQESVDKAFDKAINKFKRIDVVVNNAGYALCSEFESMSERQIRMEMEVNFFGVLNVTRKAIEVMRELKTGGLIQQISSVFAHLGYPTFSMYCASKWALEGFTQSIAGEMKPEWGIKFTLIEPGGFRTNFAGASMEYGEKKHPAYDHIDTQATMEMLRPIFPGDPVKGAKAFYDLAVMDDPPLQIVVGSDAYTNLTNSLEGHLEQLKKYETLSNSTDADN
ncbi:NAD(P)-binding protein [Amniculicola lignicola CBS 123094]|uniref:NAD(P)-binding protein n=1 Tax=Amniculicola lignicola CBS 123094 TaxID=1392246 RepID=A0A6A5VZ72_9PLEO|nr:NAD(P)-binding protein [Amniculicola lignicola CBS 123094]